MAHKATTDEKREMREFTADCWWTKPVCWSGIRNDLERQMKLFEGLEDGNRADESKAGYYHRQALRCQRLAAIALDQVLAGY